MPAPFVDESKLAKKAIKKLFKILKEYGVNGDKIRDLTNNTINALGKISQLNPDAFNSVLETINKVDANSINSALHMLGQINPTGVNEALTTITSTLNSININEVNTLVENVSGAADVIVRSEPLVQGALKAITFSPIIQGINCLLSLGTLITGILTVRELKNIKQELVLIRNELTAANEKLDEMIRLLNIQIVLSRQIAEGIDRIDHSVSFRGKQDEIINQRNISNIRDHYKEGRYKESIQYSNECLKFKLPEIFYYRGLSLYELGHYFAAIENFTKAFELDKHNVEYLYWRGLCSLHLNLTENAKKDFQRILQVRPTWPQLEAHLCLIASNYANAAQKYAEITRQRNAREAVSPEIKKYNLYYLMGLARLGSENRNDAEVAFSLAALGTSSKMTEIRLFLQIHDGDNTQLSDTELQYLEAGLSNNMTTTAINFMAQNQGLIFNYSNGDVTLLNKLRNGARTNQLNAKHAKSLYLLAQQLIKLNELVEGMYFCKLAADLGNIEAQQQIIKCHEILEGTQTFSSFVNWNFVKAAVQATFIGFQLTTEQKNWSLAKYYAAIIHFRGLFNKEKDTTLASNYFTEIENSNLLAKTMLGYYHQYERRDIIQARRFYENARALPLAKYYLSVVLSQDMSIAENVRNACQYYQQAYDNGILLLRLSFAKLFYHGVETTVNYAFAFKIFSSYKDNLEAQYYQARCHYLAQGTSVDQKLSKEKLEKIVEKEKDKEESKREKSFAKAITALSAIYSNEKDKYPPIFQSKLKLLPSAPLRRASIVCNERFAIQFYQDNDNLICRIGRFVNEKISWQNATTIINQGKNPRVAMNKNGDICLALKNFDSKLLYMVGKLHNNGNLVWGDPLQLNVECFGTPLVTITDDGIAMLAYEGKYEHKYRLGELSHNNTINWGPECDYSWRCGTLKSAAIFQHENREFVVLFTAERDFETFAPGTISYEIGLLKDKEIIWQKNNFVRDDFPYSGYSPAICVSDNKILLAFTENNLCQASMLYRATGEIKITFSGLEKFTARIDWNENTVRRYDLGALPTITCGPGGAVTELHEEHGELSMRQFQF